MHCEQCTWYLSKPKTPPEASISKNTAFRLSISKLEDIFLSVNIRITPPMLFLPWIPRVFTYRV